jgi:hypothetical protein
MKFYRFFLCLLPLFTVLSCTVRNQQAAAPQQGIKGQVTFTEGNLMPGPGKNTPSPKGVQRNVFIYAVAAAADVVGEGPLYTAVNRPLVAKVKTDAAGFFQCRLKPGRYSVFTEEKDGKFFSSLSNDKGELSPVEVVSNQVLEYNILVNYAAVY